jgi:hypothetical protein
VASEKGTKPAFVWSDGTEPGIKMPTDKDKATETKVNCVAANNTMPVTVDERSKARTQDSRTPVWTRGRVPPP